VKLSAEEPLKILEIGARDGAFGIALGLRFPNSVVVALDSQDALKTAQRNADAAKLGTRYQMREKLVSIGDDFWIENADGERVFKVDGKAMRVRDTLVVKSPSGEELFTVRERKLSIRDKMTVERDGDTVATVHKALVSPLRQRFKVELEDGGELEAHGNIVDHEYEIERDGHKVAEVSKRWLRVRDTYGIEIAPSENQALVLALTICIDQMAHD